MTSDGAGFVGHFVFGDLSAEGCHGGAEEEHDTGHDEDVATGYYDRDQTAEAVSYGSQER